MSTPTPVPPSPTTIAGDLAAIKAKLEAFEAKQVGWLKAHWPHLVTWAGGAFLAFKHLL